MPLSSRSFVDADCNRETGCCIGKTAIETVPGLLCLSMLLAATFHKSVKLIGEGRRWLSTTCPALPCTLPASAALHTSDKLFEEICWWSSTTSLVLPSDCNLLAATALHKSVRLIGEAKGGL